MSAFSRLRRYLARDRHARRTCGVLLWLLSATPAAAQAPALAGTLVGPDGVPVAVAAVYVFDAAGTRVGSVLSDTRGRFRNPLPVAGTYDLRVERIGFETELVNGLVVPATGVEATVIALRVRPLVLDPLEVSAERVCRAEVNRNPDLIRIWSEARKALAQTALAGSDSSRAFQVEVSERVLTPDLTLVRASADTLEQAGGHAFTFQPVEELGATGWGEKEDEVVTRLFGPSPEAFLSPRFGATHCLSLADEPSPDSLVGLAFESIPDSLDVGLEGTFWIDPASWRLRRIDFRYTGTPSLDDAPHQGGTVVLDVGRDGAWYAAAWSVRGPVLEPSGITYDRVGDYRLLRRQAYRVTGYLEHAGRVLAPYQVAPTSTSPWASPEALARMVPDSARDRSALIASAIRSACGAAEEMTMPAVVAGTVTDSVSGVPLARALVRMEWDPGIDEYREMTETRTDASGYYQFCSAPGGKEVSLVATLRTASVLASITVEPGTLHIEHLRIPLSDPEQPGLLLGRVIDADTRRPVADAEVRVDDIDGARALTNRGGYFSLGERPWGVYVLSASALGYAGRQAAIRIQGGVTQSVEIELTTEAIPIEGLVVSVRGRRAGRGMEDMLRRMRLGLGSFLTRDVIERRPLAPVAELLREVPGVQVHVRWPDAVSLEVRGSASCVPDVFVDGTPWLNDAQSALTSLTATEIEAIEVYRGLAEVPGEFIRSGRPPCAVVVIWTR
jgi:hypothetical protein